ncbi:MAG: hypothetical protein ACC707_10015, partial [Thiohalomonadales bacterium]
MKLILFKNIFISMIAVLLVACGEGGVEGSGNKPASSLDLKLFQSCFALSATNECSNRDFNGDGYINYDDLRLLKSANRFDLSKDGYIDISMKLDNSDRNKLD